MPPSCEDDLNFIGRDSELGSDDDSSGPEVDDDTSAEDSDSDGEAQWEHMGDTESESSVGETDASPEIEAQVEVPEDIKLRALTFDIACHPKRNLIAAGLIDGDVVLHSYGTGDERNLELQNFKHHKASCRAVHFSLSGERLFSGDRLGNINELDLELNSIVRDYNRHHASPISSILPIDECLLASGEDKGQLVLWDSRAPAPIDCFTDCEFPISSLAINEDKKFLLATCSDSRLRVYNVRTKKLVMQSEEMSSDLLCCGIFKDGAKAVVGSADGALNIFNWGEFGNVSERFPSHPKSVESLVVLSDDVVITGCDDGKVRAVQMLPNSVLGYLGSHKGCPIKKLRLTFDSKFVASSSYDQKIKFWDLSGIGKLRYEEALDLSRKRNI